MTVTLATVACQFLERKGLAASTLRSYELTLIPLLKEYGRWPIEIISRQILTEYLESLNHLKYTTHHRHQAIVQSLCNFAVEQGYIKSNPIAQLKRRQPTPEKGESATDDLAYYLTNEQLNILYKLVASDLRMNAIVRLLHRTGARIGELLSLDLENVDQKNSKFQVIGKGNKRRWCFYSEDAAIALADYIQYKRHNSCPALFTAQQPKTLIVSRISYSTVRKYWQNLIANSPELKDIRLHDLRHTFATERVGLMGIEELRALMGHTSIQTTLRYQKVTSARAENVARMALNSLVNSPV